MMRMNSRLYLEHLLSEMIEHPEREAEIAEIIDDVFGQNKAVMVLDMSGFCRTTREHSIALVLSMIYRMRTLLKPPIEAAGGRLIKAEADNLFCLFDTVADAVGASRRIRACLEAANGATPEHCRLGASIGIGYGHILNIEDEDLFGDEVNLASKLGEDIADCGEILLTENAFAELQESALPVQEKTVEVSGFALSYRVVHGAHS